MSPLCISGKIFQEEIKIICKYTEARKNERKGGRKGRKAASKEEGLEYSRNKTVGHGREENVTGKDEL